ncbi:MAG: RsmD family RNA methyltransferase [Gaiellaceae bacterium]
MRVIAGSHRGRRIAAPKGEETRPTSDRVRLERPPVHEAPCRPRADRAGARARRGVA